MRTTWRVAGEGSDGASPDLAERAPWPCAPGHGQEHKAADGRPAVLDLVLFVNGIPLVVVEGKSPHVRDPLGKAIRDLRAYGGRPLDDDTRPGSGAPRGAPPLTHARMRRGKAYTS
ncbi:type I restriction endonuclease [Streptomyces sp. NPDC092307]|uniref:type I restriction endonuclease n=1 Tax=Streptomyces sp. NPDC092307 TaxID=3366013 RepID=UPI0037FA7387